MATRHRFSALKMLLGSAALSCASVLALAYPTTIHAEDPETVAERANAEPMPENAARIGSLLAATEFVHDDKTGRRCLRLVALNTSPDREEFAHLEVTVQRTEANPMARVGPAPEIVWEQTFRMVLPPGERDERRITLPAELSAQIVAAEQEASRDDVEPVVDEDGMPPTISLYHAVVAEPAPADAEGEEVEAG